MKNRFLFLGLLMILIPSCMLIENNPYVVVNPTTSFKAHIRKDSVYITSTISANPTFIDPGGIPTIFYYRGEIELFNEESGVLLNSSEITGDGLNTLVEVSTLSSNFEHIIITATGTVSAYADKGSDGNSENDLFMHESDFYEVVYLKNLLDTEGFPVVTLAPTVSLQNYFLNSQFISSASISANPDYIVAGNIPVIYTYDGVLQISDEDSGSLLKSKLIDGSGLSIAVSILADTVSYRSFVIVASGTITAKADLGSDGDPANDLFITSTEFNIVNTVDLGNF